MSFLRALIRRKIDMLQVGDFAAAVIRRNMPYIRWQTCKHYLTGAKSGLPLSDLTSERERERDWVSVTSTLDLPTRSNDMGIDVNTHIVHTHQFNS